MYDYKFELYTVNGGKLEPLPQQFSRIERIIELHHEQVEVSCHFTEAMDAFAFKKNLKNFAKSHTRLILGAEIFFKMERRFAEMFEIVVSEAPYIDFSSKSLEFSFVGTILSQVVLDLKNPMPWETPAPPETESATVVEEAKSSE